MSAPAASARVARLSLRPAYGDTDQSGVVHHAVYLGWLEEARTLYLREGGVDFRALEQGEGVGLAVVDAQLRYRRPARFDDALVVEAWVSKLGRAQLCFDYRVLRGEELLLEGQTTLACIDIAAMRAIRLPESIRACCEPAPA